MRIAQRSMYRSFVSSMNNNLSDYMESNIQGSSQKRINRPSDDPVGMARVLGYRASIAQNMQYLSNSKDAASQLSSTDSALTQAQTILAKIKEKAGEIATGTVTTENRLQTASELRQLFGQLLNLANTNYNGQQLFAGHKTGSPAYQEGLGITTTSPGLQNVTLQDGTTSPVPWEISGSASRTVMVRFQDSGNIPPAAGTKLTYEYSKDGGETWIEKDLNAGETTLDMDGVIVKLPTPGTGDKDMVNPIHVDAYDPAQDTKNEDGSIKSISRDNGTVLFIRPTAYYQGDDNDPPPVVDNYPPNGVGNVSTYGEFSTDVRVRLDSNANVNADGTVNYSYSTDNGVTWIKATADTHASGSGSGKLRLQVPGGYLDVTPPAGGSLQAGQQMVVRPRRADQGLEIAQGEFISVTNSGKDIFGGMYTPPGYTTPVAAEGGDKNIFEVLSNLIAWAETGPSEGCGEALDALTTASEGLLTNVARVGGKENRVSLNVTILESHQDDQTNRMSKIEDVDLTELLTRLTQQQMAYQTVLQSSSMIMQLNLTKFI